MNDKFWEADKKLREALGNQDSDAAEYWADVCQLEQAKVRVEEREGYIRIHGKPPMVQFRTTSIDGPTWEVSEKDASKIFSYRSAADELEYYENKIKAHPLK